MNSLRRTSFVLALLVGLAAAPARAGLIFGGSLGSGLAPIVIDPLAGETGWASAAHTDGLAGITGSTAPAIPAGAIPLTSPGLDLSHSFTSSLVTSDTQIELTSSLGLVAGNPTLVVTASPPTISVNQTDSSGGLAGPGGMIVAMSIPFTYASVNATETMFFDLDFDVAANIPALTAADVFALDSCIYAGSALIDVSTFGSPGTLSIATQCANAGGTLVSRASLGAGTVLPTADPVSAFNEVVDTNVQYVAAFILSLGIKNDTGPTTLSLENFTLTASAVPEPGTALLVVAGLLALGARGRRTRG